MSKTRQLSALLITSISEYKDLLNRDEIKALEFREIYLKELEKLVDLFNGSVSRYLGDGTLSIFSSTVEAVNCAIALQQQFKQKEIPIKIGIHVGDIVRIEDDVVGDALHIVSKIEACSVTGSVLISDKVHDQIRSHRMLQSKFLDVFHVDDLKNPLTLFALTNDGLVIPDLRQIKESLKESGFSGDNDRSKNRQKYGIGILVILLLILGYFGLTYFGNETETLSEKSIAVLPFENLSTDEDSEIFTDGITEDILTHLSKISGLHVISRSSVRRYKNTTDTNTEIANKLGVAYLLQGSIRKYGDKVRVSARLVLVETDEQVWVDQYDRTITDIFEIQSEVSQKIANALDINMSADVVRNIERIATSNMDAYKLFLRGRKEADKRNRESIAKSIDLYEEAIKLDPNYAEAYAEIANSVYLQTYYSGRDHIEASKTANQYLDNAEAIDPNISRIYSVRGLINNIERKYDEADVAFQRAIALSPNDLTAHHQYSTYFYYIGEYEKQLIEAEIAYKLDPLSFATANSYVTALVSNNEFEKAETVLNTVTADSPDVNQFVIYRTYFRLYLAEKDYASAIRPLKEMVKEQVIFNRFLAFCYGKIGDTAKAYNAIKVIQNSDVINDDERNHQIAIAFGGIQDTDSILYYLDTIRNNQTRMLRREGDVFFDYLKDNERYKELLESHGITQN